MTNKTFFKKFGNKYRFTVLAGCSYWTTDKYLRGERPMSQIFWDNAERNLEKLSKAEIDEAEQKLRNKVNGYNNDKNMVHVKLNPEVYQAFESRAVREGKSRTVLAAEFIEAGLKL